MLMDPITDDQDDDTVRLGTVADMLDDPDDLLGFALILLAMK
jgi:hypothetical protein